MGAMAGRASSFDPLGGGVLGSLARSTSNAPQDPSAVAPVAPPPDLSNLPLSSRQLPSLGALAQAPAPDDTTKKRLLTAAAGMAKALQQPPTAPRRGAPSDFSVAQPAPLQMAAPSPLQGGLPPWMQPNPSAFYGGN